MKTEDLIRQERRGDPQAVSRALQETAPLHCTVVDSRGKKVPLSSAGYVLRPSKSYRVRVVSPFPDRELKGVKIINEPDCVSIDPEMKEVDEEGRTVRSLPFKVKGMFFSQAKRFKLINVKCEELEIAQYFQPECGKEDLVFTCPIVIRPRWPIFVVALVIGLILMLLEKFVTEILWSGHVPASGGRGMLQRMVTDVHSWLVLIGLTGLVVIIAWLVNASYLYHRSRELRKQFRETYPS